MATPSLSRLQILGAALLFSTGGAAVKAIDLTAWQVAAFRSAIAALVLFAWLPSWRRFWQPRVLLVGVAYGATMIFFVLANRLTTAANTIFLQGTAPMYLLLLSPWILRERIRGRDLAVAAALATGMALFFLGAEQARATAPDPPLGNLIGACAGLSWAFTLIGLRYLSRGTREGQEDPAGAAVVAGNLLAACVALPFALPLDRGAAGDWLLVAYLGIFQIGVAYVFMTRGVRHVPAFEASLLLVLEPVASAIWAWLFHGERPAPASLAGCAIILGATVYSAAVRSSTSAGERRSQPP